MEHSSKSFGRMELAQLYFPYILPRSAWQKLKSLLVEDPALKHLVTLKRRSFLPLEVNIIYQKLGHPQNALKMGISEDFESVVSGGVVNRKPSALPLTVDLYSARARFLRVCKQGNIVNQIHNLCAIFVSAQLSILTSLHFNIFVFLVV